MTIKMIRVYETLFEFDTDDESEALSMFGAMPNDNIDAVETEQCCITESETLLPGEKVIFDPFEN